MTSYRRLLRHRDFRFLFLGQSASAVGDQVVIVALALYITQRTGSPTDLGLVLAAQSLPLIGLVLFGGVWADRLPRHRIMTAADYARALLHAVLAASIVLGGASVAEMIVIEALFGAARAFFQPAYSGLLPQTIPDALVQDARALSSTTENLAILIGPALGAAHGPHRRRRRGVRAGCGHVPAQRRAAAPHPSPCPRRGARSARRSCTSCAPAGARSAPARGCGPRSPPSPSRCCAPTRSGTRWRRSSPVTSTAPRACSGVLESVAGAGAVLGALLGIRWRPRRPMVVGLLLTLVWPLQSLAFAAAAPLAVVVVLAFGAGLGFTLFEVWWATALVRHIPPQALSRVSAYDWMGSLALLPLGFAIAGPLAAALGARTVLAVGAAAALAVLALALAPRSTRALTDAGSAEELADDVAVEAGREPQVADVDALVRVVHEGSRI